jgi:C4-dicarboxylate transporter DctM subunit
LFARWSGEDGWQGALGWRGWLAMTESPFVLMLLINLVLIVAGMFWDTISSIILLAPLFTPLVIRLGYEPVFFGVIMT